MRKHLSTFLKIIVSIVGLFLAFRQIHFDELQAQLVNIQWAWLVLGLLFFGLGIVLRAYRWLVLVQGLGLDLPFRRLVRIYFVGAFFNTFLPTGFGGDVMRVVEASNEVPTHIAAGTVIVDRLTGLLMLFVMALFALPFRPTDFPESLVLFTIGVSLSGLLGGGLFLEGKLIRRLGGWLPGKLSLTDSNQPLAKILDTVQACGWQAIFRALMVSTVFNFFLVGAWWVLGRSLNLEVPYGYYLLVVPIMSIVLLVPSIGGLGVRETLAPSLFMAAGLDATQAVALALIVSIVNRTAGLVGGPIYAFSGIKNR